jgi:hypothetical protein
MGAHQFQTRGRGLTIEQAFEDARDRAWSEIQCDLEEGEDYEGYSGTVYEKTEFRTITFRPGITTEEKIRACYDDPTHWCNDKWGPAAALKVGDQEWIFFGYASS